MTKEMTKVWRGYQESREKAVQKSKTMSHGDALEGLKSKLPEGERKQMSLLMEKGKGKVTEDDKAMFVKAVQTLNTMYIGIEDERTNMVMTCHNEIFQMFQRLQKLRGNINKVASMHNEAYSEFDK